MDTTKNPAALMASPLISFADFRLVILDDLPASTCEELIRAGQFPPIVLLGRRRYVVTSRLSAWVAEMIKTSAYTPRRNRRNDS